MRDPGKAADPAAATWWARLQGPDRIAAALIAAQLAVLGWVSFPGSFVADDLVRASEAADAELSWSYLTADIFGHLAPGYRLMFWVEDQIAPLNHDAAVFLALACQAVIGALAWSVLRSLLGDRYAAVVPLVLYLFSSLVIPSFVWWASSLNLIPCHLALLAATRWHLISLRTGRFRYAAYGALALAVGLLFWEKTALLVLELPLLTLAILPGPLLARLRSIAALWRHWLVYSAPVALFAVPYLAGHYLAPSRNVAPSDVAWFTGQMAWRGLLPGLAGGPLDWTRYLESYFAIGNAPASMSWAGLAVAVAIGVAAVVRRGGRPVAVLALIGVPFAATAVLTVYGRANGTERDGVLVLDDFQLAAMDYRYLSDLLVPAALAAGLAFCGARAVVAERWAAVPAAVPAADRPAPRLLRAVQPQLLVIGACALVMIVFVSSAKSYREIWRSNPVGEYVANARATIPLAGDGRPPALFDSPVPEQVFGPQWNTGFNHPSRVLAPLRDKPAYSEGPPAFLSVLDDKGRARRAGFNVVGSTPSVKGSCPWFGPTGSLMLPLAKPVPAGSWTVVVYYFATGGTGARLSTVDQRIVDPRSKLPATSLMFVTQKKLTLNGLSQVYGYTAGKPFTHIYIDRLSKPICVVKAEVGAPVPIGAPGRVG